MLRVLLPAALAWALLATACARSDAGSADPDLLAEARELRQRMLDAGITAVDLDPPEASEELLELGQALFFDKILSGTLDVSCATCHLPRFATGDARTLSRGVHGIGLGPDRDVGEIVPRNSPALFALHLRPELFWDGRVGRIQDVLLLPKAVFMGPEMREAFTPGLEVLGAQATLPPVSPIEMRGGPGDTDLGDLGDGYGSPGGDPDNTAEVWRVLTQRVLSIPAYFELFRAAYPDVQPIDLNFAHIGNAIAAFEAHAFDRTDSPFDRFLRGDDRALDRAELAGARAFLDAGCAACHQGPLLSDDAYHNTGLPQLGPGMVVQDATANLPHEDFGREHASGLPADRYAFRTASLLNVELTAPYGHAGQFAALRDMVAHYRDVPLSNAQYDILANVSDPDLVDSLAANAAEVLATLAPELRTPRSFDVDAIVTFLRALTAEDARDLSDIVPESVPSLLPIF